MAFTTADLAAYYQYTPQTIRVWAAEFAEFLSVTATPQDGKNRRYTADDLTVFALIAEMKGRAATFEEIHAALKAGQRGDPPDLDEKDLQLLNATAGEKKVSLELVAQQRVIVELREQLNQAQADAAKYHEAEKQIVRLERDIEHLQKIEGEKTQLKAELKEAQARIEQLIREAGEQYTKGVLETLERVGQLPQKNANHQTD